MYRGRTCLGGGYYSYLAGEKGRKVLKGKEVPMLSAGGGSYEADRERGDGSGKRVLSLVRGREERSDRYRDRKETKGNTRPRRPILRGKKVILCVGRGEVIRKGKRAGISAFTEKMLLWGVQG